MKSLVILASGSGTNAVNIVKVFSEGSAVKVKALITDRENAPVRAKMDALGVPVYYFPRKEWREHPETIAEFVKANLQPDLVILAGFNSILKEEFVNEFKGRILNIHPSLLPAYGGPGMWGHNVHEAVLAAGEKESGVTVHIVTNEVDGGPIVLQETVPVLEGDTPESLEMRIHEKEYSIYPRAIAEMLRRLDKEPQMEGAVEVIEESDGSEKIVEVVEEAPAPGTVPPPIPPDEQWADALGIPHGPNDFKSSNAGSSAGSSAGFQPVSNSSAGFQPVQGSSTGFQPVSTPTPPTPNTPLQAAQAQDQPVMPPTYMLWAILSLIFCCLPAGIVAVIFAARVSAKYYEGDYEASKRASRNTEIWIIVSFVLGVLTNTLYLPFMFLIGS